MNSNARNLSLLGLLAGALLPLAGCDSSSFEPPEAQGPAAMVDEGGKPRMWVLTKQEEDRMVGVGGGGRRSGMDWRTDTYFHFSAQAIDPLTTKTLWTRRLVTFGDPEARGTQPSRVIGSSVDARLLGQEGERVWLLIGAEPYALNVADGNIVANSESLQKANPQLKGLLPSEAKHYGFDQGLVLMTADARQFVVRGPGQKVLPYTPPPPRTEPLGRLQANGTHEMVPMRPLGEPAVRQVTLGGRWLGLYTEKEAADAGRDEWGRKLRYPWDVHDEGKLSRRRFWRAKIITEQRFDDRFERLSDLTPIDGSPTYLKGRFKIDPATGEALLLSDPESVLIWHSTRIDDAGRLAMTRLDARLKPLWTAELPLSETDIVTRVSTWLVPGHMVMVGTLQTEDAGVTSRTPQLVSLDLKTGAIRSRSLVQEGAAE